MPYRQAAVLVPRGFGELLYGVVRIADPGWLYVVVALELRVFLHRYINLGSYWQNGQGFIPLPGVLLGWVGGDGGCRRRKKAQRCQQGGDGVEWR